MNNPLTKAIAIYEMAATMETECEVLRKENKRLTQLVERLEESKKEYDLLLRVFNRAKEVNETPLLRGKEYAVSEKQQKATIS